MSPIRFYSTPNRYICSVLDEMRKCYETRNFAPLLGLIEEAQSLANRMESALSDKSDVKDWTEKRRELKAEIKKLMVKVERLKKRAKKRSR